jgi:hypothetical protein
VYIFYWFCFWEISDNLKPFSVKYGDFLKCVLVAYLQADNADVFIVTARRNILGVPSQYYMMELPESYTVIY